MLYVCFNCTWHQQKQTALLLNVLSCVATLLKQKMYAVSEFWA